LAPVVFSSTFGYPSVGPTITIKFNKDVGGSLVKTDLTVRNLTTNQTIDLSGVGFIYNPNTQTAVWTLPISALADGNYRATLTAAAVTDAQGRQLDGNADGTAGDDFTTDFFHLAGDINHDRSVDFLDLAAMAQNYNTTGGMTWAQGDLNGDGNVDFLDLAILAQRYNTSLAAPAPSDPVGSATVSEPVPEVAAVTSQPQPVMAPLPVPTTTKAAPAPKPKPVPKAIPKQVVKQTPRPIPPPAAKKPPILAPAIAPKPAIFGATAITRRKPSALLETWAITPATAPSPPPSRGLAPTAPRWSC
jgi:hypothetical protein